MKNEVMYLYFIHISFYVKQLIVRGIYNSAEVVVYP